MGKHVRVDHNAFDLKCLFPVSSNLSLAALTKLTSPLFLSSRSPYDCEFSRYDIVR